MRRPPQLAEFLARDLSSFRGDLFGGLTAAVVALPLALAFGVASGLGPIAGLYGAIAVGFFAAIFGGTPAQVSGPTGPMTVVMTAIVVQHADDLTQAFAIVCLGGAFQVVLGLLRVGQYVSYTPYPVISGFMSGIGVIIITIQVLPFVGVPAAAGGPTEAIQAWPDAIGDLGVGAIALGALSLAIMIFWPSRLRTIFPPPLAALIIGTLGGVIVFHDAPTIGAVPTGLPSFELPLVGLADTPGLIQAAIILALLGSIDSLLTSLVADSITRTRHNSNRELTGQGLGNIAAGLIGGLPGAGATMRTVINVRAGGRTPLSGTLHAIVLLSLVMGLGPLAEKIPLAVLAGILVKVGWDIIDWNYLRHIRQAPREKVVVMLVTLGLTVFVDLITAVAVGLILAGFVAARTMEVEELKGVAAVALPDSDSDDDFSDEEREILERHDGNITVISLRGRFSYASAQELVNRLGNAMTGSRVVIYDLTHAAHIDTSAAIALDGLIDNAIEDGLDCLVAGLSGEAEETLNSLSVLKDVPDENSHVSRTDAIRRADRLIAQ